MEKIRGGVRSGKRVNHKGMGNRFDSRDGIRDSKWLAVLCHSYGQVRKIERGRERES